MRSFGILTFAFGMEYAKHAYALALSALAHGVPVLVIVPAGSEEQTFLKSKHVSVQPIIVEGNKHPFWYEQYAFDLSPFTLTLKMDADCLIPKDANMAFVRDLIDRHGVINGVPHSLTHEPMRTTAYREREVSWGLPTVYSTMFGFTKDGQAEAYLFYQHIKMFCHGWGTDDLSMTKDVPMTTDTLYSMAWAACHNPSSALMGLPFHHVKPATMGWGEVREDWTREVPYHVKGSRVYIGGHCVTLPIHYQDKNFCNDNLINELEAACTSSLTKTA